MPHGVSERRICLSRFYNSPCEYPMAGLQVGENQGLPGGGFSLHDRLCGFFGLATEENPQPQLLFFLR
eukprot:COSAG02_NODE_1578_length_11853_cov_3.734048_1_plen_68_part_00